MELTKFSGEYPCTLDDRGRILFPAALKKMVPAKAKNRFMIHRGIEKCMVIYAMHDWDVIATEVQKLNPFKKDNREFQRYFFRGATELELDGSNRLLLPKSLCDYAQIKKDVMLFAYSGKIEVWNEKMYHKHLDEEPRDYEKISELVSDRLKLWQ